MQKRVVAGVRYREAPRKWVYNGSTKARKRVRTEWWRYELCDDFCLDFGAKFGLTLQENREYEESSDDAGPYTISASEVRVCKGFRWDGSSGPTGQPKSSVRATLVHDVMCLAISHGILLRESRHNANLIMLELLRADGMSKARSNLWYTVVEMFS